MLQYLKNTECCNYFDSSGIFFQELKSLKNLMLHLPSFPTRQPIMSLNRFSTWRKLQANITASHYNRIQQFQQERQQECISLSNSHSVIISSLNKQSQTNTSKISNVKSSISNACASYTSSLLDSSTKPSNSSSNYEIMQIANLDQPRFGNDDLLNTVISVINSVQMEHYHEIGHTENENNRIFEKKLCIAKRQSFVLLVTMGSFSKISLHSVLTLLNNDFKSNSCTNMSVHVPPNLLSLQGHWKH